MISAASYHKPSVIFWLYACMAMVFIMVFVGGVTRLTESGLSIVEWKLVTGILPPLTQEGWEAELQEYRDSPEYKQVNKGMNVTEFKQIYWLEYLHRLFGRITGLVFIVPLVYFTIRKQMDRHLSARMFFISTLVGAQGVVGWLMVQSGLIDDPRVHPIKLAMHLSLAFTVFSLLVWTMCQLRPKQQNPTGPPLAFPIILGVLVLTIIQIVFGAFVAGMDAGMIYNTYPLMDGELFPSGLMALEPWHRNLVEYIPMVQFQHRVLAKLLYVATLITILYLWKSSDNQSKSWLKALFTALHLQFALGVLTLIYEVPLVLASLHQLGALVLLSILVVLTYRYHLLRAEKTQLAAAR